MLRGSVGAKAPRAGVVARAGSSRRHMASYLAAGTLLMGGQARALIPDDDDPEMVEKAKAKRQEKVQQDKQENNKFLDTEGIKSRGTDSQLVPIQTAVFKLAKAGEALEKDDTKTAANTLTDTWVSEFESAGKGFAKTKDSKNKLSQISEAIKGAADAAGTGNTSAAKVAYVSAVEAVEGWVQLAGISGSLKGL